MSTPQPAIPERLLPQVHFTINKNTSFDPKVGHQRMIEAWLLQLLRFIGLKQDIPVGLIYRKKVSGLLGATRRLAVIGPDRNNPCAIGFRVQPGDNGTCVEMHVIFPRNAADFFPPQRAAEGMVTSTGIEAISTMCKEALASDLLVLGASAQDENIEMRDKGTENDDVPSAASIIADLEKRLDACTERSAELEKKIRGVKEQFDRATRLVIGSRPLALHMPPRMTADFEALVDKHLASLAEEKQVAFLEIAEDVKKFEQIRAEIAKLERAIAALRA